MANLVKIFQDFKGISLKIGPYFGLLWLWKILANLRSVIKKGDLQPADEAMGVGPFRVKYAPNVAFSIEGYGAFSGIREMYVRDTYLHNGILKIQEDDVVLDLGSNMGNFANLALAHGKDVLVIAVEPNLNLNKAWHRSIALNEGFLGRAKLFRAFVGKMGDLQNGLLTRDEYADAGWLSENELLNIASITKIDFLKCDIEGGEFDLLRPGSEILRMARKVAIEVHQFAGDVDSFLAMLVSEGFNLRFVQRDPDGSVTALGERENAPCKS